MANNCVYLLYNRLFSVDNEGIIRVQEEGEEALPYDQYTLLVSAVDGGSPVLETSVPVYVNLEPKLGLVSKCFPLVKLNMKSTILRVKWILLGPKRQHSLCTRHFWHVLPKLRHICFSFSNDEKQKFSKRK